MTESFQRKPTARQPGIALNPVAAHIPILPPATDNDAGPRSRPAQAQRLLRAVTSRTPPLHPDARPGKHPGRLRTRSPSTSPASSTTRSRPRPQRSADQLHVHPPQPVPMPGHRRRDRRAGQQTVRLAPGPVHPRAHSRLHPHHPNPSTGRPHRQPRHLAIQITTLITARHLSESDRIPWREAASKGAQARGCTGRRPI